MSDLRKNQDVIWSPRWRHQIEISSALLALCEVNSSVTGEFPSQRPVTRGFDVFFDLRMNRRLCKPSRRRWFETLSRSLWRHLVTWYRYPYPTSNYESCIQIQYIWLTSVMIKLIFNHKLIKNRVNIPEINLRRLSTKSIICQDLPEKSLQAITT